MLDYRVRSALFSSVKNSWHVILVSALLGAYLAGFGVVRAGCTKVWGPSAGGPGILIGPEWYQNTNAGRLLSEIYWPMFWFENKITGEYMCHELTERHGE